MSTIQLTNWDYFSLKLINPFIDVSTLVEKRSFVKTFGVRELMHIDDYQIYKKQEEELLQQYTKMNINNDGTFLENSTAFLQDIKDIRENHVTFTIYRLMPGALFWTKTVSY